MQYYILFKNPLCKNILFQISPIRTIELEIERGHFDVHVYCLIQ